jgi:hypothetical protein
VSSLPPRILAEVRRILDAAGLRVFDEEERDVYLATAAAAALVSVKERPWDDPSVVHRLTELLEAFTANGVEPLSWLSTHEDEVRKIHAVLAASRLGGGEP